MKRSITLASIAVAALVGLAGRDGRVAPAAAQVTETYTFRDAFIPLEGGGGNELEPVSNGTGSILTSGDAGFIDGAFVDVTISASACASQPQVRGWSFPEMTGLRHPNSAPVVVGGTYSISMLVRFDPMDNGYARLIDFSGSTEDAGIYKLGDGVNFYPLGQFADGSFVQGQDVFVTITRDGGTQEVSLYINGQPAGVQDDSGDLYAPLAAAMYFLMDNTTGSAAIGEVDPGIISYLQLRDTVMSPAEVTASLADICATVACGDGNVDPGEECDDGGVQGGDGCSSTCELEPGLYTVPSGVSRIRVELAGGGGGAGGLDQACGGAGGAGGLVVATLDVSPGNFFAFEAGQGGGAGEGCAGNAAGGAGGTLSFGPVVGGDGGNAGSAGCSGGGGGGGAGSFFVNPLEGTFLVAGGGGGGGGAGQFSVGAPGGAGGGVGGAASEAGEPGQTWPPGGDGGGGGGGGGGCPTGGLGGAPNPEAGPTPAGAGGGESHVEANVGLVSSTLTAGAGAAGGTVDAACVPTAGANGHVRIVVVPVIRAPSDGSATIDRTPAVSGECETGVTVTVTEGATTLCTAACVANAFACDSAPLADGDHTIVATQAGLSSDAVTFTVGVCGDGSVGPSEACDDGDVADGDGCSAACTLEFGWSCTGSPSDCVRDIDADGVTDPLDNCPFAPNADQADVDGDGLGDVCDGLDDRDLDGDGDPNIDDNCPFDANPGQEDADGDGIGDACDTSDGLDVDGDGDPNTDDNCPFDANPGQEDADGDGLGDACDPSDGRDVDGDGAANADDNCPYVANPNQEDADGDGLGDACDDLDGRDRDDDGVLNDADNCPFIANPGQEDGDGDGRGDACDTRDDSDGDGDGVADDEDNCPTVANASQADEDGDDLGDACDATVHVTGGCADAGDGGARGLGALLALALAVIALRSSRRRPASARARARRRRG